MKKWLLTALIIACFTVVSACNNDQAQDGTTVAIVDSKEITEGEFIDMLKQQHGSATLNQMITLHLLKQAADGVEISDEDIEAELDNMRGNFGAETDEELLNLVKEQIEVESLDEFIEDYIVPPLVLEKLTTQDVNVTEEQEKEYYEENKEEFDKQVEASHILVEEEDLAKEILDKLQAGEDFAELAKEHSIDGSASRGGDLGYFPKGKMVGPFEDAAFSMKVGEMSDLVKSEFGYHIIKVTGIKETFEDYKEDIENALIAEQSKSPEEVISQLIEDAKIDIKDPQFSNLYS